MDTTPPPVIYDDGPEPDPAKLEALRLEAEAAEAAAKAAAKHITTPTSVIVSSTPAAVATSPTPAAEIKKPGGEAEKGGQADEASNIVSASSTQASAGKPTDKPLILYAYAESSSARPNIEFFIAHALHSAADFVFILNGDTDIDKIIPDKKNIKVVKRPNDCYDLGAYSQVLLQDDFYKKYKRFIMLNASIRGPFIPYWSDACWTDMYLNKVTDEVKLVGMTANCWPTFHIQSMIWATDIVGINVLLFPPESALAYLAEHPIVFPPTGFHDPAPAGSPETPKVQQAPGINGCFHSWDAAVAAEVSSTSLIRAAGYKVDAMMSAYQGQESYRNGESCAENVDVLWNGKYWGSNVGLYETGWMKSNRDVDPVGLEKQSEWVKGRKYSSYDYCKLPTS